MHVTFASKCIFVLCTSSTGPVEHDFIVLVGKFIWQLQERKLFQFTPSQSWRLEKGDWQQQTHQNIPYNEDY